MSGTSLDVFDNTVQKTYEWLRDISQELGDDNRRHAYLALRGTLHAVRDFLPLDESAQFSAQLPLLIRGLYFEGWKPSATPETERSRESFLRRIDEAMERALWNEDVSYDAEQATRAVLRVISTYVSGGEIAQVKHTMPQHVRELWPEVAMSR